MTPPTTSFVIKRVNSTTFGIQERDKYREHPLIYAKIHPAAPIVMLSDTGCDAPAEEFRDGELQGFLQTVDRLGSLSLFHRADHMRDVAYM